MPWFLGMATGHANFGLGKWELGTQSQRACPRGNAETKGSVTIWGPDADVSGLELALKVYWRDNELGLGKGQLPADVQLVLGSKIKLWSAGVHKDIGHAYGHPSLDGKTRCPRCKW